MRTRASRNYQIEKNPEIFENYYVGNCLFSTVTREHKELLPFVEKHCKAIVLNSDTKVPINNKYKTSKTLGPDRLAAAVGGYVANKGKDVLVYMIGELKGESM